MIPIPLILPDTPDGGYTLTVSGDPGGLAGATLLSVSGPALQMTLNGAPVALPFTLAAGDTLTLTRTGRGSALTVLHATVPVSQVPAAFTVTLDPDGFPVYQDAQTSIDPDGYLTVTNATSTTDPEGYVTLERTS